MLTVKPVKLAPGTCFVGVKKSFSEEEGPALTLKIDRVSQNYLSGEVECENHRRIWDGEASEGFPGAFSSLKSNSFPELLLWTNFQKLGSARNTLFLRIKEEQGGIYFLAFDKSYGGFWGYYFLQEERRVQKVFLQYKNFGTFGISNGILEYL